MLTYLYTLDYDDDGPLASARQYMANGTKAATSRALTTTTTPLSAEALLRHAKMMNNVVVYAIAQKYNINELKELAAVKFRNLLWFKIPDYAVLSIIGTVYETSSVTDRRLRLVAAKYCAYHSNEILDDDSFCSIIEEYSELGLDVLREVNKYANRKGDQKQRLRGQLVTLEWELKEMLKEALGAEKIGRFDPSVTAILQKLRTTYNNLAIEHADSTRSKEDDEDDEDDEDE